jgi:biotin carboxyl carrier protein
MTMMERIRKYHKKIWAGALLIAALAVGICSAAGKAQTSSLSGQVVSVVSVGTTVSEGTVLVSVKTLAGSAPAARANCSGKVVSVKVTPGSQIQAGQVVAEIQ